MEKKSYEIVPILLEILNDRNKVEEFIVLLEAAVEEDPVFNDILLNLKERYHLMGVTA